MQIFIDLLLCLSQRLHAVQGPTGLRPVHYLQIAGATQTMARFHLFAPVLLLLVPNHSSAQCSQTTNYRAPSAGRW